jgi:hypothetical protein
LLHVDYKQWLTIRGHKTGNVGKGGVVQQAGDNARQSINPELIRLLMKIYEYKKDNPLLEWMTDNKLWIQSSVCVLLLVSVGWSIGIRWGC